MAAATLHLVAAASFLLAATGMTLPVAAAISDDDGPPRVVRPDFKIYQARSKQHRAGARGDLVDGEEHLRKIILGWYHPQQCSGGGGGSGGGAVYEICHQCQHRVEEETGQEKQQEREGGGGGGGGGEEGRSGGKEEGGGEGGGLGKVYSETNVCGGEPCLVLPAAPLGLNRFHLRCKLHEAEGGDGNQWTAWSEVRTFDVGMDVGHLEDLGYIKSVREEL